MDEMQFLSQFNDFREGLYTAVDPIKTVLAAVYFALPRLFFQDSASQLIGARVLGLLAGVMIAVLCAMTARRLYADRTMVLLVVGCLVTFTTFSERGFRIRADLLQALFAALGLVLAMGRGPSSRRSWWTGIAAGGAFICTQKAVYVLAAFLLATLLTGERETWRGRVGLCLRLLAGWGAVLLITPLRSEARVSRT